MLAVAEDQEASWAHRALLAVRTSGKMHEHGECWELEASSELPVGCQRQLKARPAEAGGASLSGRGVQAGQAEGSGLSHCGSTSHQTRLLKGKCVV